jgi:HlyD family secretion protein
MKAPLVVLRLAIVLVLFAGGYWLLTRDEATQVSLALGTLERDRVTLSATAAELIVAQPVAEGSSVAAGALLVQLDTTLQTAYVHKVEADIAQQQAALERLRNGFRAEEIAAAAARADSARTLLQESERDLERVRAIVDRKVAPKADLDSAAAQRDNNAARLRDAEAQLALLRAGSRSEDLAQAEAQLLATQALLAAEQTKLANLSISSTVAGTLDSLPWNVGERVATGAQVAVLLAAGAPYARVYVPETHRAAVSTGSRLLVHVDGVATAFSGTVRWVSNEPAFTPYYALNGAERSRLVYMAEVQLPEDAAALPAGLPAQVELP